MSNHNTPPNSNHPPNFSNPANNHHPQMGVAGNYQNQNFMQQPFRPNMQPPPQPFMNAPNQLHMSQMGGLVPQNNANYNNNNNPMFPVHGQGQQVMHNVAPQMNLSQIQGQILAQNLLNLLQQPNMNMNMNMNVPMPNGQFCPPVSYPMQNMNQQLPMQMQMQRQNPSQGVPYGMNNGPNPNPMFGFPNQVNHAMVPQNPMFSGNPQFGVVPGNQVRPQIDSNEKNRVPANGNTNGFVSGGPFPPQQLQGNSSVPQNANNAQSSAFRNSHSQENPNTNFANSNWKGSPNKNFKNKQNRGGSQGGFQKSKFRDNNKGNKRTGFPKEHNKGKGPNNERAGNFGLNSEELQQEPKKSFIPNYSEQEIQQWREARKKNHPSFRGQTEKFEPSTSKGSKVIDREVLQRQLKEVLAKQAELGVEVAEIPPHYLKNGTNQGLHSEEQNNTFRDRRKSRNNGRRNPDRRSRNNKKQKLADKDFLENKKSTLLQKLLSADIKRDKSYLLQVFRFMTVNSFFKDYPGKPLVYPSVLVKEVESEVNGGKKHLQNGKAVLEHDSKEIVQNLVNDSEDEESDEFDEEEGEILE